MCRRLINLFTCAHLFIPDKITPGPVLAACVYHNWGKFWKIHLDSQCALVLNPALCDLSSFGPLSHQMWQYVMYWFLTIIYFRILGPCVRRSQYPLQVLLKIFNDIKTRILSIDSKLWTFMVLRHVSYLFSLTVFNTAVCVTTDVLIQHYPSQYILL